LAIEALVRGDVETSILDIACSRYGSFVIEQLAMHRGAVEVAAILACNLDRLRTSEYAKKVMAAFGFARTQPLA